jgi:uncharacterized protein YecT (DUF1311 family)
MRRRVAEEPGLAAEDLKEAIRSLEHAQSSWKSYRNAHCDMVAELYTVGSGKAVGEATCTIDHTMLRIHELWEFGGFPGLPEPK